MTLFDSVCCKIGKITIWGNKYLYALICDLVSYGKKSLQYDTMAHDVRLDYAPPTPPYCPDIFLANVGTIFVNSGNTTNQKLSKNWWCILNRQGLYKDNEQSRIGYDTFVKRQITRTILAKLGQKGMMQMKRTEVSGMCQKRTEWNGT